MKLLLLAAVVATNLLAGCANDKKITPVNPSVPYSNPGGPGAPGSPGAPPGAVDSPALNPGSVPTR